MCRPRDHFRHVPDNGRSRGNQSQPNRDYRCHNATTGMPMPQMDKAPTYSHLPAIPRHRSQQGETPAIPSGLLRPQHIQHLRTPDPTTNGQPTDETIDRPRCNSHRPSLTHTCISPLAGCRQSRPRQRCETGGTRTCTNRRTSHMVSSHGHLCQKEWHAQKDD